MLHKINHYLFISKKKLHRFSVLKQDYERLHLLLAVTEGEGFQYKAIEKNMYGKYI